MPGMVIDIHAETIAAANSAREKHWAEQLRDTIVIGEAIDLPITESTGGKNTFFAIFTAETTATPRGAIVLMHGAGVHPDWGDVIHPLRTELPDKGWATLSIQLPLTSPENDQDQEQDKKEAASKKQLIEASVARIDAAISFLKSRSYQQIVLISHSFGSLMALNFLQLKMAAETGDTPPVKGAVLLGTPSSGTSLPLNSPSMIEKITLPLLDLYGSADRDNVLRSAKARKTAAHKAGNQRYRQAKIIGANHFYNGLNDELLTYVSGWLSKNISNARQK